MPWRLFLLLIFALVGEAAAGDLPTIPMASPASIDDAVADFVGTRYKMKLVMPFGMTEALRPGGVILSKQDQSQTNIWKLENEKLCQPTEHAPQVPLRDPIKQSPYVIAAKLSQPSSLLGLSADLSMSITRLEISSDTNLLYTADTDVKAQRTADALAKCANINTRSFHSYVLNSVRAGILKITIHFVDQSIAEEAKQLILRERDSKRLSVNQIGEQLHIKTIAPVIFGITTRSLASR